MLVVSNTNELLSEMLVLPTTTGNAFDTLSDCYHLDICLYLCM